MSPQAKEPDTEKGITSVWRALEILEHLSRLQAERSVAEISNELGINRATCNSLMKTLQAKGYLIKKSTGKYLLGSKLYVLGNMYRESHTIIAHFERLSVILAGELQCAVQLAILSDPWRGLIIAKAINQNVEYLPTGTYIPLHATSLGKALLAHLPPEQIAMACKAENLVAYTDQTITDPAVIMEEISRIQQNGYALDDMEYLPDRKCIAAPVFNHQREVVGAVSFSGLFDYFNRESDLLLQKLLGFARNLSIAMGFREL